MRLQFLWILVLLVQQNEANVYLRIRQGNIVEWLASILFPPTTTTTAPPIITSTTQQLTSQSSSSSLGTSSTTTTHSPPAASTINSFPIERDCPLCRCGLINTLHKKIIGGHETRIHQYPWMAVILLHQRFYCSGSLISDLYVLTVAHCLEGVPLELITVRFLEHNRSDSHDLVIERQAAHVKIHELHNPRSFDNDIALIRLNRPLDVDNKPLRPICLPVRDHSFDGELAIVTGWGAQREGGFATDSLQEVEVLVLTQMECRLNSTYKSGQITDNMICAGYLQNGGRDACSGDSGGPLHVHFDEQPTQYQLAGLVSWGEGCARPQAPGVYTRVSQYLRWIERNTPGDCLCMPYPEEDY
ncbi:uncharacterized protein Dwil_GK15931 [Drosophila willistoni]|uniref:Peptidase S1 domain-containing protein n=1 Tax=Drosophila willistoni TaxID=7260 RepID=B4MS23_DROWI|nr:mite allergen Der p 3 [Drosophila willistoni]EDW74912.1 uncharacterized protein Dwil_GK15931 [Drosophila willistoni]